MFGEDMEGKYVFTLCGWPRQPLCLLREMAGKEAVATTNLTTLVHHIAHTKASLKEQTRDFPRFPSQDSRLTLGLVSFAIKCLELCDTHSESTPEAFNGPGH